MTRARKKSHSPEGESAAGRFRAWIATALKTLRTIPGRLRVWLSTALGLVVLAGVFTIAGSLLDHYGIPWPGPRVGLLSAVGDSFDVAAKADVVRVESGFSTDPDCPPATCTSICVQVAADATISSIQGYAKETTDSVWRPCHARGGGTWLDCEIGYARFPSGGWPKIEQGDGFKRVCWQFRNWADSKRDARLVVNWTGKEPDKWEGALEWCARDTGDADCPTKYVGDAAECLAGRRRACLISKAIVAAKMNQDQHALELVQTCQCHNQNAQWALTANEQNVLAWLRRRAG